MENFELWFGRFGNGITVCNKAREINGDYEHIAHISPAGNISYYADEIPADAVKSIEEMAANESRRFRNHFERLSEAYQRRTIFDSIQIGKMIEFVDNQTSLEEMRKYYYSVA